MMEYIPLPDDIPPAHYFLEQLNTPWILTTFRVAVILIAAGLLVTYVTVISKNKRKPMRVASSRMALNPEDTVVRLTSVRWKDETKPYVAAASQPPEQENPEETATRLTAVQQENPEETATRLTAVQQENPEETAIRLTAVQQENKERPHAAAPQPAVRGKPEPKGGIRMKKGLFGYSKQDVDLCFQHMKDDFVRQMREIEAEKDQEILALKEQIAQLQAENDIFNLQQAEISSALINAERYSKQLKEEALEKQRQEIIQTQVRYAAARDHIKELEGDILLIQQLFTQLMDKTGHMSQKYLTQCSELTRKLEKVRQDAVIPNGEQAENQSE